jgi:hypothetical protein
MSLSIAYIYLRILPIAGVDKKPVQQAAAIKKLGIKDFDVIVLNPNETKEQDGVKYVKYRTFPRPFQWLDYIFKHNFWRYKIFEESLDLRKYDYLILRYPSADKTGINFFKKHNVITEHHTNEYVEFLVDAKNARMPHVKILKYLRYFLEKRYGTKMLSNSAGIITNTDDVKIFEISRLPHNNRIIKVPNGITVDSIPFTKFKKFDQHELNIALLGSYDLIWHGTERLIKSINRYSRKIRINLHLIGGFKVHKIDLENASIFNHGSLNGESLDVVLNEMNIASSTLALYTKDLDTNCSLKTREYIARGLPFILAYDDDDLLEHPPEKQFFLQFPNDPSPIDFEKVIEFVKEINSKYKGDELSIYMREYAKKYMDWTIKMQQYYNFVKEIDESRKARK